MRHALCIDTALIYRHPKGPPYKPGLKWLAQKWLDREVQGSAEGHDSEEDARTCVDLLKLKIANGTFSV
jgi:RNA exonuclease 1